MAYYSYSYYHMDDHGEYSGYSLDSYYNSYDSASVQDSVIYSSYNSNDNRIFSCDPVPFCAAYDSVSISSRIAYSVSTPSEPKLIEYDPASYYSAQTQFVVSYSVSQFNDTEFEEYDPTPYGGGYDIAQTYGKPLPPSDEICYPRSTSAPPTSPLDAPPSEPTITPAPKVEVDEHVAEPQSEGKPAPIEGEYDHDHGSSREENLELYQGEENNEKYGDNHYPWSGYEHERQVPQIPSGYGLEAMDICEGLFGYWPCLSRYGRRWADYQQVADCGNYSNQWEGTADYLFGSPYPYGERRDDENSFGNAIYGYQKYYQQQSLLQQVEDTWSY